MTIITEIITLIYNEIKILETHHLPAKVEANYEPLEDLNGSVYFQCEITEITAIDIKVR